MINLGSIFIRGDGVKLDKKKATQLWKIAAERGNAMAQAKFSTLFVHSDPKEALRWMTLSAQQGFTAAESLLGHWRLYGMVGVEMDIEEGKRWLARAAAKGHERSIRTLEQYLATLT